MKFKIFIWFILGGYPYVDGKCGVSGNPGIWLRSWRCLNGGTEKIIEEKITAEYRKLD